MQSFSLLANIATALGMAFIGGLIVQRIGLPTIIGYLLAGIVIGPFTPGFVGDDRTIAQLADLGVVFLMFGVGLHFSFSDLWKVRDIAIMGALGQMAATVALGFGLSRYWGWSSSAGLVLGLAIAIASTIVLLRGLMDHGLLNTSHGQVAVGWLVVQDIATVLILLVMPSLSDTANGMDWHAFGLTILAAVGFLVFMLYAGVRFIPWLLLRVAHTRSRELFILAILTLSLGVALAASELFGVSLALGAFVAGAVVSESPLSHRIASDLLPFREAFSVLFFVSIGMLLDPHYLLDNVGPVLAMTGLIVLGKPLVTASWAFLFRRPARTALIVAAGSSQIGEFSFILGQTGLALGLLERAQYSLILAGALMSITINPLMLRGVDVSERCLRRIRPLWRWLDRYGSVQALPLDESMVDHVVIAGCGRVGKHIVGVLGRLHTPYLVIDSNIETVQKLTATGVPALLGDTANSDILAHAGLGRARMLVVTLPEEAATELTVAAARDLAPQLPIIARAATRAGVKRLSALGAQHVIHPELEGGLQVIRHTLLQLGFPLQEVRRYAETVRSEHYEALIKSTGEERLLSELLDAQDQIEITWLRLPDATPLEGCSLGEVGLRSRTGATVVAIAREGRLMLNPITDTVFQAGDRIGLIGNAVQLEAAEKLIAAAAETYPDSAGEAADERDRRAG